MLSIDRKNSANYLASPSALKFPFGGGFTTQNDKLTFLAELIPGSILFCHSTQREREIGKKSFIYLAGKDCTEGGKKCFGNNLKRVGIRAAEGYQPPAAVDGGMVWQILHGRYFAHIHRGKYPVL